MDVPMSEQTTPETRPAGTSALIYGLIAVVTGAIATPVSAAMTNGLGVIAGALTFVAGAVALITGIVKRLAGGTQPRPNVGRLAAAAVTPAAGALLLGVVAMALAA